VLFFVTLGAKIPRPTYHLAMIALAVSAFVLVSRFVSITPILHRFRSGTRISFIESLTALNQSRNFRMIGGSQIEVVGCTIYDHNEGPQGCPDSAVFLGCTWKKGPEPLKTTLLFRGQPGGHCSINPKPNTVFVGKHQVIGYTDSGVDSAVRATSAPFTASVPEPDPQAAHVLVLANAGAAPVDKHLQRVRDDVQSGTGHYVNGIGKVNSYTALV